jgi:hypothetical protein
MTKYTLLIPAHPAEHCYLREALYWRAFGRLPQQAWSDYETEEWRFSSDIRESVDAPIPEGEELEDEECAYAGLPIDPRMAALLEDDFIAEPEFYERMLKEYDQPGGLAPEALDELRTNLEKAYRRRNEFEAWLPKLEDYLDEFRNEVILDLRRGRLTASGTPLPVSSKKDAEEICRSSEDLFVDTPVVEIAPPHWVSDRVDWDANAIFGRDQSYIWVFLRFKEVLDRYPPSILVDPTKTLAIGRSVAIVGAPPADRRPSGKRGRPPLPWDQFHVEVARLYASGNMPEKKEAAIAHFQEWFRKDLNKEVSRSAIGNKLKLYFDAIDRK